MIFLAVRHFGNNLTAERTVSTDLIVRAASRVTPGPTPMTQIIPATRSDDSKFSWSRSSHFLAPDTYRFHFLTPDIHPRAAILSPVPGHPEHREVDTGTSDRRLAATRFLERQLEHKNPARLFCAPGLCAPPFANTHDDLHLHRTDLTHFHDQQMAGGSPHIIIRVTTVITTTTAGAPPLGWPRAVRLARQRPPTPAANPQLPSFDQFASPRVSSLPLLPAGQLH